MVNTTLRSRIYSPCFNAPTTILVDVRCKSADPQDFRYPKVESFLDYPVLQPYVHDIYIRVRYNRTTATFRIFFKRHMLLPLNPHLNLQGDILVMRVASQNRHSVVNMRSIDTRLVDRALNRYTLLFCRP